MTPGGTTWRGNVFGSDGWSSTGGALDRVNNVENIWIEDPTLGMYEITVNAFALRGNAWRPNDGDTDFDQHFSLVCYNCTEKLYVDDTADGDTLEGYWKFDEGSGSKVYDLSPRGNHLDRFGTPSYSTDKPGVIGTNYFSMAFNDDGSYSDTSPNVSITDEFSMHLIVKREASGSHFLTELLRHDDIRLYWNGGSTGAIFGSVRDQNDELDLRSVHAVQPDRLDARNADLAQRRCAPHL